jgi:hypothetical protein
MSHGIQVELYFGATAVPLFAGSKITLTGDATSNAKVRLDPGGADPISLGEGQAYDLYLVKYGVAGTRTPVSLMRGAIASTASYERAYRPPVGNDPGEDRRVREATLKDPLWRYSRAAGDATVTHTATDSHAELRWVAEQIGVLADLTVNGTSTCPPIAIPRIDYTRDTGYWGPLLPYFQPFDPFALVDPSSQEIRLIDTTGLGTATERQADPLTTADYNDCVPAPGDPSDVTQVRIAYRDFSGEGATNAPVVARRRVGEPVEEDDGSVTIPWAEVVDVADDPDAPTVATRTDIPVGEGMTRVVDGEEVAEDRTLYTYEADYTRLTKKVTTSKAKLTLPGLGEVYRDCRTTTETLTYSDDPVVPYRKLLDEIRTVAFGLYVYTYTGAESKEADVKATGTPLDVATWNRNVDAAATSSQRWDEGQLSTIVETHRRTAGGRLVTITAVETDDLRKLRKPRLPRTEIGDTAVDPVGRVRSLYLGTAGTVAQSIDATRIGKALGVELGNLLLARLGVSPRTVRLTLAEPDYTQYRLGSTVTLDTDAPFGFAGRYLCTQVEFDVLPPDPYRHDVRQTLTLTRLW